MTYLQRKKLAFMSIVNQIKGFVRSVSGTLPLTLSDCVDTNSLIRYTINGNGVGDYDENASKYKIPVVCSGKNVFSGYNIAIKGFETHTFIDNGVVMTPTSLTGYQSYISFKLENVVLGRTYTASVNLDFDTSSGARPMIRFGYVTKGNVFTYIKNASVSSSGRRNITFTVPEVMPEDIHSTHGFVFLVNYTNTKATELVDLTITDIQLEEGTTATDYEPYVEPVTTNIYLDKPLADGQILKNPVKLPTFKGTTVYTIGTSIQPTNMSATYYATSKE